ncbi:MAG: hypothetical protein HY906_15760, partial [Deltaproteobacteria bacterium]|nr:hypothetical protein [Deltaproteobacteria bacterium]
MGFDAYVWIDLEFPSEPKDCMNRWKQSPLDGAHWSDWGGFGFTTGPVKGFETVAAVLAQAARYAARERLEGRLCIFSVALGPTQVKVRAFLDKSQTDWWRSFAVMARAAAPLDAVGEFGWATAVDGVRECYLATIGDGQSQFHKMTPDEVRRLDRHPAVADLDAKRAALPATAPAPVKLQAPTPRPPGSRRGYRRRGYGGGPPRTSVVPVPDEVPPDQVPPDEEAVAAVAGLDDEEVPVADPDLDRDADTGAGADDEGAADEAGVDVAPARTASSRPPQPAARPAAMPAAAKPAAPAKVVPEKAAPAKAAARAAPKPTAARPATNAPPAKAAPAGAAA